MLKRRSTRALARTLVVVIGVSAIVSGCATAAGTAGQPLTPAQQALRAKTERFSETVATGAIAGAVLGGLAMALLSDNRNRGRNMAMGAAAGAALGGAAGYYVASGNERYGSAEQEMSAKISAANREVTSFRGIAESSQQVIAENKSKISTLQAAYDKKTMTAAQVQQNAAAMQDDLKQLRAAVAEKNKVVSALDRDIDKFRGQGRDTRALESARNSLQEAQIEAEIDDLARALAGLPRAA